MLTGGDEEEGVRKSPGFHGDLVGVLAAGGGQMLSLWS